MHDSDFENEETGTEPSYNPWDDIDRYLDEGGTFH